MNTASELLTSLASKLGLSSMEPTDEGLYVLKVDSEQLIFIRLADEDREFILFGGIGTVPKENEAEVLRALLEANNFWVATGGFNLSLVPATQSVLLTARTGVQSLNEEALFDLFDRFVSMCAEWRDLLPRLGAASLGAEIQESLAEKSSDDVLDHLGHLV